MVFFTSRFVKEKGMFDLLEAVAAILSVHPECRFTFIGGGPDAARFKQRISQLGLEASVTYLPNKSFTELIEIYRQGGIFVFPSHFPEGMPMALIEAMAVGLLAISSSVRFVRGVPSFAEYPLLALSNVGEFPEQIARSVIQVVGNQRLREEVGEMNKSFAKQYSQQLVTRDFLPLYRKLAGR
jgi:glycosyltransferase involved in cell wall biosynthesis